MIKHIRILPGGLAVLTAGFLCLLTACRRAERRPKATMPDSIWRDMSGSLNINRTKKRSRAVPPACISACSLTVPAVMKREPMKFMALVIRR